MKNILFLMLVLLLVACSDADNTTAPDAQPPAETPTQDVNSDNGQAVDEVENEPEDETLATKTLTNDEAMAILQDTLTSLQQATEAAGYDTTIETIQKAWTPYVTDDFWTEASANLQCDFDYCGAFYNLPNSIDFGWQRTFNIQDDTFTTEALYPNIGDSVGLFSTWQAIEMTKEDDLWKINRVDVEPRDMNLTEEEVIPYLAQIYDIQIDDFSIDTLENGEFQHGIYVFTHPEYNEEYFVDAYTGTMYERAFFEEFITPIE